MAKVEFKVKLEGIHGGAMMIMKIRIVTVLCVLFIMMCWRLHSVAQTPALPPALPAPSPEISLPLISLPNPGGNILNTPKRPKALKNLSFIIDRHPGWLGDDYEEGGPISIRCTFKNMGHSAITFLLADHHGYHGTLPYPVGMAARVTDAEGQIITYVREFGEWWTQYYDWSTTFQEMPGDRIELKPNQQVVRIVPLDKMLSGLAHLPEGLKAGEYIVELELGGVISNKMKIKIVPKGTAPTNN